MKIYKSVDVFYSNKKTEQANLVYFGNMILDKGSISYQHYDSEFSWEKYIYVFGETYQLRRSLNNDGKCELINLSGKENNLPEVFIDILIKANLFSLNIHGDKLVTRLRNFPSRRKNSLITLDIKSKKYKSVESHSVNNPILDENIYSLDSRSYELTKLDLDLKPQWKVNTSSNHIGGVLKHAFKVHENFITFVGPKSKKQQVVNGVPEYTFSEGELTAFSEYDGTISWQIPLPEAVDDAKQVEELLFIASLNHIFVIEATKGEIVQIINTQSSSPHYRLSAIHIHTDESYIYYSNTEDRSLLIYDINSYQLVKKVISPEKHAVRGCFFTDKVTGKHYFDVLNTSQYGCEYAVMELDPNNLLDEIIFEEAPEHSIDLVPAKVNSEELELVVKINCASLDDALRFGEIYTRDYCQWHSHAAVSRTFAGREANPQFNGIVRFIYSGCEKPAEVVNDHLAIMEKRFDRWNDGEGFYAQPNTSNENELTRLIAEYRNV